MGGKFVGVSRVVIKHKLKEKEALKSVCVCVSCELQNTTLGCFFFRSFFPFLIKRYVYTKRYKVLYITH